MNSLWIFFSIAITLHNIEEAVWLPRWSKNASRFHKKVEPNEFIFAVIIVTLIAYLGTFLFLAYPENWLLKDIYFGLLGMMILNSVFPHLVATVFLKRYMPGVITGVFLMLPVDLILIIRGIKLNLVTINEVIISTILTGGIVLALLPVLFKLGRMIDRQLRN